MSETTFDPAAFMTEMLASFKEKDPRHITLIRPLMSNDQEMITTLPLDTFGDLSKIRSINLKNHGIERLPARIAELKNLIWLDLSDNPLIKLPEAFGELSELRFLRLSYLALCGDVNFDRIMDIGNQLEFNSTAGLTDLPDAMARLHHLLHLRMEGNRLKRIPPCVFAWKKLDYLDLGFNLLTEIPPEIGELTELTYLKLSKNNFHTLPETIGKLKKLQRLRLDGLHLYTLPESIGELSNLVSLEICNGILEEIPPAIKGLQQLQHFYLYETELSDIDKNMLRVLLPETELHFSMKAE